MPVAQVLSADGGTPRLAPGFHARPAAEPWAVASATAAEQAPGTLFYATQGGLLQAALILAPDRPVDAPTALLMAALALRDALLAEVPPETAVTFGPPGPDRIALAVNRGEVATIRIAGAAPENDVPAWLIIGITVRVALRLEAPGLTPWQTDLCEEGVEISAHHLLEAVSRHLLAAIDLWQEGGAAAIRRAAGGLLPA